SSERDALENDEYSNRLCHDLAIVFGSANPAAIIQTNPGNRVSGTRNNALGTIKLIQLSSPQIAIKRPGMTIHFGSNFISQAGIDIPAISRPNGTEKPVPPRA